MFALLTRACVRALVSNERWFWVCSRHTKTNRPAPGNEDAHVDDPSHSHSCIPDGFLEVEHTPVAVRFRSRAHPLTLRQAHVRTHAHTHTHVHTGDPPGRVQPR